MRESLNINDFVTVKDQSYGRFQILEILPKGIANKKLMNGLSNEK
jgi:hypothetical protein